MTKRGRGMGEKTREASPTAAWRGPPPCLTPPTRPMEPTPTPSTPVASHPRNLRPREDRPRRRRGTRGSSPCCGAGEGPRGLPTPCRPLAGHRSDPAAAPPGGAGPWRLGLLLPPRSPRLSPGRDRRLQAVRQHRARCLARGDSSSLMRFGDCHPVALMARQPS